MSWKVELVPWAATMVTEEDVLLDSESCRVLLLPTVTVPKFKLLLERTTLPPPPPPPSPWQAASISTQPRVNRVNQEVAQRQCRR